MDRRNFFKIVSTVSAGAATTSCSKKKSDALIPLLVSEDEIPPGEDQWHPSVCSECGAGCGVIARVMEGERVIERNGEKVRERIACVKKLEGNPLDPVSGGRLCALGQAALQSLYNPDRLPGPMRRTGVRGSAGFSTASWDEMLGMVSEKLAKAHASDPGKVLFLTTAQAGSRFAAIQHFLESLGAPPALSCSLTDFGLERKAAALVFGWDGIPRYDLGNARYALGVGADFLGGWTSPVYYGRQFGQFRQGRPGVRGKLVQAESRMSLTAASADEWLPLNPGTEPQFLAAIGRILLDDKLARNAEALPPAVRDSLLAANLPDLILTAGISEKRTKRIARELSESDAPLVIAGASIVHTNSLDALVVAHYVNLLLGNIGRPGGVLPPHPAPVKGPASANVASALKQAKFVFLDGANPVYTLPSASGISQTLAQLDSIVSFGTFLDDTAAYADAILPSHHPLESETAVLPAVAVAPISVVAATPFIRPLHNTRPIEEIFDSIARKIDITLRPVNAKSFVEAMVPPDQSWNNIVRQGGLWQDNAAPSPATKPVSEKLDWSRAAFAGARAQFPLYFQPYVSTQYHDGRGANLPWMQELPDPVSSSMWDLPIEIDPHTAAGLKVATGDWVRVESAHGSLEATVYVHPAAIPGVVSMAIGQGHKHYGRYASNRGANPLSIVAPVWNEASGSLAFGATRVRLVRLEKSPGLIQFSPNDREQGPWGYR